MGKRLTDKQHKILNHEERLAWDSLNPSPNDGAGNVSDTDKFTLDQLDIIERCRRIRDNAKDNYFEG